MSAKPKMDSGWLQLQRERYGPDYRYIPPDKTCTAGDLIPGLMKKLGLESESRLTSIEGVWLDFAGKANAAHSRPGRWEKGLLVVYVDHHVWLNEFKQVAAGPLLKKLQERFGKTAVRQLRFEMDPDI